MQSLMMKLVVLASLWWGVSMAETCPTPQQIQEAVDKGYLNCTGDYDSPADWCDDYLNGFHIEGNAYEIISGNIDFQKVALNQNGAVECIYDDARATIDDGFGLPKSSYWKKGSEDEGICGTASGSTSDECGFQVKMPIGYGKAGGS